MKYSNYRHRSGFTIVELLVVIVIIGILAAITIVSYTGITQKAIVSSLTSDLDNAAKQLKLYNQLYGSFPTTMNASNCPTAPNVDNTYCLKASSGNTFTYSSIAPSVFHLTETNVNNTSYSINNDSTPAVATTINGSSIGNACPSGFIPVPGSGTYSTNDFCIMKYEAKNSAGKAISTATGLPWDSITQIDAITTSTAACTGCHLVTEAEWMTVAQNILSVPSNWSSGIVGSGYIFSGHNDGAPANALIADSNDSNGYVGETNTGGNQKRTLTLTNGQVVWDMTGNVWEWTSGQTSGNQPGVIGNAYNTFIEWPNITTRGNLTVNPYPNGTSLLGASNWNSSNGIGQILSNPADNTLHGFLRGGYWNYTVNNGILTLSLVYVPGSMGVGVGFRVSR